MAGTDFSHLTDDELINGIKALNLPDYIRSKAYGIDVRETLAQMTEMTIQLGVNMGLSPDEALKWARKLQESVSQSEFDSWVATLLDGGPSIFMNTLNELRTTYPNGAAGIALVRETDPAKIYVWNGTSWEDFGDYQGIEVKDDSITSSKISDGAITPEKTTFLNNVQNMILNGDFSNGTESWDFTSNSTQTVTNSSLRVTRNSTNLSSIRALQPLEFEKGKKYLVHIEEFKQSGIGVEYPKIITRSASGQNTYIGVLENVTNNQSIATIYTAAEDTNYFDVYVYLNGIGDYFELNNITVWNLTDTFGLGKEPNLNSAKMMLDTIFDGQIKNSDYISQEGVLSYFNEAITGISNNNQTSTVNEGEDIFIDGVQRKIIRTDGKYLEDYAVSFDFKPKIANANLSSDIDYVLYAYENANSYIRISYMRSFSRFNIIFVKNGVTTTLQCRPMQFDKDDTIHIYLKPEQSVGVFVGFYKNDETKVEHLLTTNTFPNNFKQITFGFRMREVTQIDGNGNTQTEYGNVKMTENAPDVVSHLDEVIK